MLGSGAGGKKPIKEAEKLRARKAKLERVSSELTKHKNEDEKLYKVQAEQALRASEERYRELFENAGEWIITLDMDGRITGSNKLVGEYGFDRAELLGRKLFEFVPEYDKARSVSDFEALIAGSRVQGQMDVITPKGIIEVEYRDTPIVRAGEVIGVQAILTDITERKKAEEAYRSLVDHSLQGLAIFQDWCVVFTNQAMADITGFTVDEMLAMPAEKVGAFVHPEDQALVWGRHRDRLRGKSVPEQYEFRGIRKDCSTCWLKIHASLIEYQGNPAVQAAYVDITERKKTEEALQASEKRYREFFENAGEGIITLDLDGRITETNKLVEEYGFNKAELIGKRLFDFVPGYDKARSVSDFQALTLGSRIRGEMDVITPKGIIALEYRDTPIVRAGEVIGVQAILTDITERKKAEEQITKLAKFPAEDPYPVLRISGRGTVIFANKAGANLLKTWDCRVGKSVTDRWHELVMDSLSSGQSQQTEVQCDGRMFSLTFAPVVKANYVNVYGHDVTERKKAEEKLLEDQAKLKAMASKMLLTEERERWRLAVGLHDEVCQKLVLTKLALESSMNLVSDSKVLASLRIVCEGIGETIEQADSLTFELSNPVLRQLGFVIALEKYLTEEIRQKYGIEYELESDEQLGTLQDEIKNCLFRVTRELLTNVVKHAHARKVKVSARESQSQIYVRVQDDGVGFKESQASAEVSQTARFGLFSIREQLEYLGGHLEIESEPGQGTKATVVVPLRGKATV